MTAKRGGLGKGLDSLIKENKTAKHTAPVKKEVVNAGPIMMKINDVEPNRDQPRKHFEEDALLELADSTSSLLLRYPSSSSLSVWICVFCEAICSLSAITFRFFVDDFVWFTAGAIRNHTTAAPTTIPIRILTTVITAALSRSVAAG